MALLSRLSWSLSLENKVFSFYPFIGGCEVEEKHQNGVWSFSLNSEEIVWWGLELMSLWRGIESSSPIRIRQGERYTLCLRLLSKQGGRFMALERVEYGGRSTSIRFPEGGKGIGWAKVGEVIQKIGPPVVSVVVPARNVRDGGGGGWQTLGSPPSGLPQRGGLNRGGFSNGNRVIRGENRVFSGNLNPDFFSRGAREREGGSFIVFGSDPRNRPKRRKKRRKRFNKKKRRPTSSSKARPVVRAATVGIVEASGPPSPIVHRRCSSEPPIGVRRAARGRRAGGWMCSRGSPALRSQMAGPAAHCSPSPRATLAPSVDGGKSEGSLSSRRSVVKGQVEIPVHNIFEGLRCDLAMEEEDCLVDDFLEEDEGLLLEQLRRGYEEETQRGQENENLLGLAALEEHGFLDSVEPWSGVGLTLNMPVREVSHVGAGSLAISPSHSSPSSPFAHSPLGHKSSAFKTDLDDVYKGHGRGAIQDNLMVSEQLGTQSMVPRSQTEVVPNGGCVVLEPLGGERDDRDPMSLLHNLGLNFLSPSGQPMDVRITPNLVYERKKKRVERALQQLASSINYGGKKGRRVVSNSLSKEVS